MLCNSMRKITEIIKDYGRLAKWLPVDKSVAWWSENVEQKVAMLSLVSAKP